MLLPQTSAYTVTQTELMVLVASNAPFAGNSMQRLRLCSPSREQKRF